MENYFKFEANEKVNNMSEVDTIHFYNDMICAAEDAGLSVGLSVDSIVVAETKNAHSRKFDSVSDAHSYILGHLDCKLTMGENKGK